jgi:hypothetical protein
MSEMKDLLKKQYKCGKPHGKPQKPKPAPKPSSKGKPRGGRGR